MDSLSTVVAVLVALSVASERLVEIIKGIIPFLGNKNDDPTKEGWRKAILQFMAVVAGIVTALLSQSAIQGILPKWGEFPEILALGLLASGGSGFWNSINTYVLKLKDIKKLEEVQKLSSLPKTS
jgi:hypothetical protein